MTRALTEMRIVVVDDDVANLELTRDVLGDAGYENVVIEADPGVALDLIRSEQPDLLLLDLNMPGIDGFGVLEQLGPLLREPHLLPVLIISGEAENVPKRRALALGARDFVTKPADPVEIVIRVRNALQTRHLQRRLEDHNADLSEQVRIRTLELEQSSMRTLERLALAGEYRDDATHEHARRIGRSAAQLAERVGLDAGFIDVLRIAAPLHDLGKIGVPDSVLLKPGPLTPGERAIMQTHTTLGAQLLIDGQSDVERVAHDIALTHHERWDGGGYPRGVAGTDIPLAGRLVALADTFDALVHVRPYKYAWTVEEAANMVRSERGQQFDPDLVDPFLSLDLQALLAPVELHAV